MTNPPKSLKARLGRVVPVALLLLASATLHAEPSLSLSLTGSAEVPPVTTSATGVGKITVLPDRTVSGTITTSGLVPTMAHIHEAAAGKNGPVILTLTKTSDASFAMPVDAKLSEAQYASYVAGKLYVNVHSAQYPNGEIRAQLLGKPISLAH